MPGADLPSRLLPTQRFSDHYAEPMREPHEATSPNLAAINEFWAGAADEIETHSDSALFGEQTEAGLMPPAFQFSDNRQEADRMAAEVVAGQRTTISTPLKDFTDQGLGIPADGDMAIVCDGSGMPVALIADTSVKTEWPQDDPSNKVVVETFDVIYLPVK